ncbi:MAG TPA: iron-sulfur cluster assembly protein [Stellaceae bacterium]|jgi:metal-sulfur cluster biosynthetic enzyme
MTERAQPPCEFPAGYDGTAVIARLAQVLDPELDESVLDLGFIKSLRLVAGEAEVALQLPTSWCAVNFAYLMADDVRRALLAVPGVRRVTVSLGDHCAAAEIEAAVNAGRPFAEAFPAEAAGGLAALRLTFLRKGFLVRQQRLLQELRAAGCDAATICALRLDEVRVADEAIMIGDKSRLGGAAVLRRYLERRAELGLDCRPTAPLVVDIDGTPFTPERFAAHYENARTVRIALEANGSFCRALMTLRRLDGFEKGGGHVPA